MSEKRTVFAPAIYVALALARYGQPQPMHLLSYLCPYVTSCSLRQIGRRRENFPDAVTTLSHHVTEF